MTCNATEPCFPLELEREIFETAAIFYPEMIPSLLCVARRAHYWIEPLLYREIHLTDSGRGNAAWTSLLSKSEEFAARSVRHLVLDHSLDVTSQETIQGLQKCTMVTHLALFPSLPPIHDLLPIFSAMPLHRLAGHLHDLFDLNSDTISLQLRPFQSLTHLDIFDDLDSIKLSILDAILALPSLRHLSVQCSHDLQSTMESAEYILARSNLDALVFLAAENNCSNKSEDETDDKVAHTVGDMQKHIDDPAFVMCTYADWDEGASEGPSFWTVVDEFVESKQKRRQLKDVQGRVRVRRNKSFWFPNE
ncbi:Zn(2)-C6 fungal-type domain-containing protein [Mycena indigotica]|uniref:Zn(2)-C6 fungal-type domain-containing protein n=1 Tax=Mycena indigotica TaxID=2126181 RepID=A0A8H6WBJ0_9AGAR|nr:Zn(2)-C6 fungal-type domain-containing protein [Mycena indigotica]KAF7311867.1 Zn(2)-C6 fungal-type domain-containing protein [Mycena indigotica]